MLATAAFKALNLALAVSGGGGGLAAAAAGMRALTLAAAPLATLALGAGAAVGYGIYNAMPEKNRDKMGRRIANVLAFFGNQDAQDALDAESKYVKGGVMGRKSGGKGDVYIDGRKVGEIVSGHQAKAASRPTGGTSGFDGRMAPSPIGATGGW